MIRVTVGSNLDRVTKTFARSTTLREAFEESNIEYALGTVNLNGETIGKNDLDKTFADMGIAEDATCSLLSIAKTSNA